MGLGWVKCLSRSVIYGLARRLCFVRPVSTSCDAGEPRAAATSRVLAQHAPYGAWPRARGRSVWLLRPERIAPYVLPRPHRWCVRRTTRIHASPTHHRHADGRRRWSRTCCQLPCGANVTSFMSGHPARRAPSQVHIHGAEGGDACRGACATTRRYAVERACGRRPSGVSRAPPRARGPTARPRARTGCCRGCRIRRTRS